jgi:hypothetical protein
MKKLHQIKDDIAQLKGLMDKVHEAKRDYLQAVAQVQGEGKSKVWADKAIADLKKQAGNKIASHLAEAQAVYDGIKNHEALYQNRDLLLSMSPITPTNATGETANPALESLERLRLMQEMSKMGSSQLHALYLNAVADGNTGEAWLIAMENNSRDKSEKIDTSSLTVPEQASALQSFADARIALNSAKLVAREIETGPSVQHSVSKLAVGHGGTL